MRYLPLILCLFILCGMGRFFTNPIEGKRVVRWTESDCGTGRWEARVGGFALPYATQGTCIAYERGMNLPWEACCVWGDGEATCIGVESVSLMPAPCAAIYRPNGRPYSDKYVAEWNAKHVVKKGG